MKQVLAAGVAAMLLGILSGPAFIAFLRRNEFGQIGRASCRERV